MHYLKDNLRVRAARHGRSLEEELREILRAAVAEADRMPDDLVTAIRRRFADAGGVELDLPAREPMREPPEFRDSRKA